ncbi:MAG: hypothetical protein ACD_20C00148G0012 [uncultured bacterium]|nr:MAG: hypothetical protein ACD_20C00148G0012 [uncultured bacterium]HBH17777.1 hypothetical protein [Cyanobacteria bacterium UBA9579]
MECNINKNAENCTCTYSCSKRGHCCACITYHRNNGEIPGCFFTKEAERTYDRSIANFIRTSNK